MAKRFTDSDKWKHPWFRVLPPRLKCAWNFVCDYCDGAGVWRADFEAVTFYVGETVTRADFDQHLGSKILWLDAEKVWIPSFIEFQYKKLSIKNNAQVGIMRNLITLTRGLPLDGPALELIQTFQLLLVGGQSTLNRPSTGGQPRVLDTGTDTGTGSETFTVTEMETGTGTETEDQKIFAANQRLLARRKLEVAPDDFGSFRKAGA